MTANPDALDTRALVLVADDNSAHAELIRLALWSRYRVEPAVILRKPCHRGEILDAIKKVLSASL